MPVLGPGSRYGADMLRYGIDNYRDRLTDAFVAVAEAYIADQAALRPYRDFLSNISSTISRVLASRLYEAQLVRLNEELRQARDSLCVTADIGVPRGG